MTDHDTIAAWVRQGRKAGTPGPWKRGKNNPARVSREGRYIADFDPLHSNAPKCEVDAHRAAFLPDLEAAYLDLYDEVTRLRAERDRFEAALGRACQVGGTTYLVERAEKAEAERDALRADLRHVIDERDATFALMLARAEKAEAERDALRAHPYLSAEEIAAVESRNRRWHGEYDTTVSVRWEPYKPDGQRQMKAKGRWQTMTHNTSGYFRWENCERPSQARQALKGQTND